MHTQEAIRALTKIFQVVGYASGDENKILRAACEQVLELLRPDVCLFIVTDEAGGARVAAAGSHTMPDAASAIIGSHIEFCRVLNEGIAYWSDDDTPDCASQIELICSMQSRMCIPIMSRERTNGVLCVGFQSAHSFSHEEIEVYLAIAGAIAATIENARLYARVEGYASSLEEQVRRRTQELTVLYNCAQSLTPSADLQKTFKTILKQMARATNSSSGIIIDPGNSAPQLSEPFGQLHIDRSLLSPDLLIRMLSTQWSGPTRPDGEGFTTDGLKCTRVFQEALGGRLLVVPLEDREERTSLVLLGRTSDDGDYTDQEIRIAGALAKQAAMAVEVSRGYEHDKRIAHAFQQSLLPRPLYRQGKIQVACRYQPALAEADVGGDIYDVWPIKDRLALLIADLSGKGIKAAVNAAMLKFSVRSFSELGSGPAAVVSLSNQALYGWLSESSAFATLFYAEIDPQTGEMWYANAGHEAPAIVDLAKRSTTALEVTGPLAGVSLKVHYSERRTILLDSHIMVLYTDGISEARRNSSILDQKKIGEIILTADTAVPADLSSLVFQYAVDAAGGALHDDAAVVVVATESPESTSLLEAQQSDQPLPEPLTQTAILDFVLRREKSSADQWISQRHYS